MKQTWNFFVAIWITMILYSWTSFYQDPIAPRTLTSSLPCSMTRTNIDWMPRFLNSLPSTCQLNCSDITLSSPRKKGSHVLEYVAISSTLLYPRSFTAGRSLDGKAKDRAYRWNTYTPYPWVAIKYILQHTKGTILVDLDSQITNRAFFALLAASYNHRSIAWTQSGDIVCPSLFINPDFHKRVLVVNASTVMITIDRFVQKVLTLDSSWPHIIIHLHDCSQLELVLKYDSPRIVAVHCVITLPAIIDKGIFLQFSKKLKAWVHKNNQWERIDPTSLTFGKNNRFIFTNLDLSKVNTINRTLSEHKWYWT